MNSRKNLLNRIEKASRRGLGEFLDDDHVIGQPLPIIGSDTLSILLEKPPVGCTTKAQQNYAMALVHLIEPTNTKSMAELLASIPTTGDLVDQTVHASSRLVAESTIRRQYEANQMVLSALAFMLVGWSGDICLNTGCKNEIVEARRVQRPGTKICTACKSQLEQLQLPKVIMTFTNPAGIAFTAPIELAAA